MNEALEKRVSAVSQADIVELFVVNGRHVWLLLHHCGQLFVVSDEDEFRQT